MKKIIFAIALVASVAVAPSIMAVTANAETIAVLDKEKDDKKKKKKEGEKCEKSKKSCCSGSKTSEATPEK